MRIAVGTVFISCTAILASFKVNANCSAGLINKSRVVKTVEYEHGVSVKLFEDRGRLRIRIRRPYNEKGEPFELTNRGMWSYGQDTFPWRFLINARRARVLDLGCGGGAFVNQLRFFGAEAEGVDILLHPDIENIRYFHEMDLFNSPLRFQEGTFDVIYSSWSLFHGGYASALGSIRLVPVLLEIRRILKSGGILRLGAVNLKVLGEVLLDVPGFVVARSGRRKGNDYIELIKLP